MTSHLRAGFADELTKVAVYLYGAGRASRSAREMMKQHQAARAAMTQTRKASAISPGEKEMQRIMARLRAG